MKNNKSYKSKNNTCKKIVLLIDGINILNFSKDGI